MLQIKHLTITQKRDLHTLVRDFSLVLNPGDKAVIVGEEGNGKSTLLKWIYDPALVAEYAEVDGERSAKGLRLGYLPQELSPEDKRKSVYEFFSEGGAFPGASPGELRRISARLGLPGDLFYSDRPMGTLSGGEKVKAQLAALLLAEPDVLLLDEPSNDLDLETLEWLEKLILDTDRPVLYISHDETLIERTANRVILLEQLRKKSVCRHTVANMPFARFMAERTEGFEKQAQLARSERREEKAAMEKFRRIQQRVEHEQNAISRADPSGGRLLKKKMHAVKAMERRYEREHGELTAFPEAEEAISIRFPDRAPFPAGKTVLEYAADTLEAGGQVLARNLRLTVRGPEKVCIIGRNGAGKTTLLRALRDALAARDTLRASYMPQDYEERMEFDQTPVAYLAPFGAKEEVTRIRTLLGAMKYTAAEMSHPVRALSGGQKAKLLLLKMALSGADVLVLDEPTRNFSPLSGPEVRALLQSFPGAILSVSHDRKYIAEVCGAVYELTPDGLTARNVSRETK